MKLGFVTSNTNKFQELQSLLETSIEQVMIDLPEVQAIDVREVIEAKARAAYDELQAPALVEDTGLFIPAWNGLPGALIRWFLQTVGNEGICQMLSSYDDRRAVAETFIGYFDGESFFHFSGKVEGSIAPSPRGEMGFGWDAIFIPTNSDKTFAEMTMKEKEEFSMRKIAVQKLNAHLAQKQF